MTHLNEWAETRYEYSRTTHDTRDAAVDAAQRSIAADIRAEQSRYALLREEEHVARIGGQRVRAGILNEEAGELWRTLPERAWR